MTRRRIYDAERHAHFVTFSCYKRRKLLDHDRAKKVVLGVLNSQLTKQNSLCGGFVLMPDHVHVVLWFPADNQLSHFMKQWKQRSSIQIKRLLRTELVEYGATIDLGEAIWQPPYYDFNLYSEKKLREKLDYIHLNPVQAGLASGICDWPWNSARYYEHGRSVGVPITWLG